MDNKVHRAAQQIHESGGESAEELPAISAGSDLQRFRLRSQVHRLPAHSHAVPVRLVLLQQRLLALTLLCHPHRLHPSSGNQGQKRPQK